MSHLFLAVKILAFSLAALTIASTTALTIASTTASIVEPACIAQDVYDEEVVPVKYSQQALPTAKARLVHLQDLGHDCRLIELKDGIVRVIDRTGKVINYALRGNMRKRLPC